METAKKITKYALMGLGGFLIFSIIMGVLFGEDTTTLVAPATTVEATAPTTVAVPTSTTTPTTTTTKPITVPTRPADVPPLTQPTATLSHSDLRDLWVSVVRQHSADMPTLTWADLMTDQEMLGILDVICDTFESGVVERGNDMSAASYAVIFASTQDDSWTDDDTRLLAFGFGAGAVDGVCP